MDQVNRRARSVDALDRLLRRIEAGRIARPDWITFEGECRLDRLPQPELERMLVRLHAGVLRGFTARNTKPRTLELRANWWRSVARAGFHDFSDLGWRKPFASPFVENFDYVSAYEDGGVDALDPYLIYSSVLGTHDFTAEEFLGTDLCAEVETIVEPMAGTAEFSREGHFLFPDLRFVMVDLDAEAQEHVLAKPWIEGTEREYLVADVLDEATWKGVRRASRGRSLAYIGKQSHHLFGAKQVHQLMQVATRQVDFLMLETPQISLVDQLATVDELTRPEMRDAGFRVALINEPDGDPNPFTNQMHFRLDVWDRKQRRTLFHYHGWTAWYPPTLVAFAELLDLDAFYYSESQGQFVPVAEKPDDEQDDCHENPTFMIFTRRSARKPARKRAPRRPRPSGMPAQSATAP